MAVQAQAEPSATSCHPDRSLAPVGPDHAAEQPRRGTLRRV